MAAPRAFGMIGVNGSAGDRGDRVVHISRFIYGIGVDRDLNVVTVGHRQAVIDSRGSCAPILMELQATGASGDLFFERGGTRSVSFDQEAEVHRKALHGFEHARYVPFAGRAGSRIGASCRSRPATDHGRRSIRQSFVNLLRRDEMNMTVDASGGDDPVFARDDFGGRANDEVRIDTIHRVRISRLTDSYDAAVPNADITFDYAPVIDDDGVRYDEIENAAVVSSGHCAVLPHAVANDFASPKRDFITVDSKVFFDFDHKGCIRQTDAIAHGRPVKIGISTTVDNRAHDLVLVLPLILP